MTLPTTLVIQCLHGLAYGMLLFLVSSGLTLVFGMMNILNLAHASFYMLGAYFFYQMLRWIGNFSVGLIICPILVALQGILMERFLLRRVHASGHVQEFVLTAGIAFVVMEAVKWIWETEPLPVAIPGLLSGSVNIMGNVYPAYRLFILFFSIVVLAFMAYILMKTRLGIAVRAAVADQDMVSALGTVTPFVFMRTRPADREDGGTGDPGYPPSQHSHPPGGAEHTFGTAGGRTDLGHVQGQDRLPGGQTGAERSSRGSAEISGGLMPSIEKNGSQIAANFRYCRSFKKTLE